MNRVLIAAVLLPIALIGLGSTRFAASDDERSLPGAAARIDASRFPNLQSALDAVPDGGGIVVLPPGRFEIEVPLRVAKSDVCIEGSGTATHLVNTNQSGSPALRIAHPEQNSPRTDGDHDLWRIRISNLRITGNEASGSGILAERINEIFIQGVTISHNGQDGIRLDYCYEDPRISDNLITYNRGVGVALHGCHDIVVSANQFEENQDALHCFDGFNLTMTGNNLDDHLGRGVVIENTYGSVVSGNMIEECQGAAIVLDRDCYGIALSANVIAHNGQGILLFDAHGCSVSANAFTIMKKHALLVSDKASRIAVTGNSFGDSYIGDGQRKRGTDDLESAGVQLDAGIGVAVVGNTFSGLKPWAIEYGDSFGGGLLFAANTLTANKANRRPEGTLEIGNQHVDQP